MSKLELRQLGKNGPMVSCIGLGCMVMSNVYGPADEAENMALMNRAIDLGCTFWDTADLYALGENEKLLSKVLKDRRNEIFICTKFAFIYDPDTHNVSVRGDKEYVRQCCEASLKRLGIDTIDLYYQHRVDPNTPIEETVTAMAELVKEGKVRYLGLSECSASTLRKAYAVHPIAAVQVEYSPWETSIEKNGLLEACRELGVAIVAYSPLGRGLLSGKLNVKDLSKHDYRSFGEPRYSSENIDHNMQIVKRIEKLAEQKGVTSSQLCLAWVLAQGEDVIPIPGTKRIKYLEENIAASKINLSKDEIDQVCKIMNEIQVKGERYDDNGMKTLNL